ncbi:MAG: type II toxin-antitoxin system RelE/ParE family toxin [Phormidesmis sp.]
MADNQKRIPALFYQSESGKQLVRDWLMKLEVADRKIIGTDIKTVEFGWPIGMPTCRPMGKGLYEVRSSLTGSRIARVLFCIYNDQMILLHGFIKKSQKTPKQELDIALDRKRKVEASS